MVFILKKFMIWNNEVTYWQTTPYKYYILSPEQHYIIFFAINTAVITQNNKFYYVRAKCDSYLWLVSSSVQGQVGSILEEVVKGGVSNGL